MVGDLGHELDSLRVCCVVDASLEDAAPVSVGGDLDTVRGDGVVDELVVLGYESVQALLDHVVSVQVLDERDNVGRQSSDDRVDLRREMKGPGEASVRAGPTG